MRRRGQIGALLLASAFLVSGCGEKPITLTEEEETAIVTYAAHVVSKFNTRQPDGLSHVPASVSDDETLEETEQTVEGMDAEQGDVSDDSQQTAVNGNDSEGQEAGGTENVTLSEALGLEGIKAECTGTELKSSYVEPDYYALDATAGNTFLIVHVTLTNETDQAVACDVLSQKLGIQAKVNDSVSSTARTTILLNDLGTYQETIEAGESVETVLFFEVPADEVGSVESLKLTIEKDDIVREAIL